MFNDGANEGYWRFQIRDKNGRWVEMGGGVTFNTNHPNYGPMKGVGVFDGGSGPGVARIKITDSEGIKPGVYEIPSTDIESAKAIIPINAPGLAQAKRLDAADGVAANPATPVTLESLPEATPSPAGENAYYVEFEGTKLDSEEAKRGVHMYVGQGYKLINKILRDNPEGSVEEFIATSNSESYLAEATGVGFDGEFAATAGSKIADLDYAISTTTLKNDTKIYRGMTAKPDRYQMLLDMEPGDEFQDFGYVSTSTIEKSAMSFTSTSVQGKEQGRKPILFRIDAPAGSNALRTFSGMNTESEIVLPRGTKIEVVSKSQRDGVLIIDAKIVSNIPQDRVGVIDVVNKPAEERVPTTAVRPVAEKPTKIEPPKQGEVPTRVEG